jgi:hypothetical protein
MLALIASVLIGDLELGNAHMSKHPERFMIEERVIIEEYYHRGGKQKKKGLPPGLAKRGGKLPPGLQKKLAKDGRLPPGLERRTLPVNLERRLPRLPKYQERVIVERHIILIDRRSDRILDIIEDVVDLIHG